MPACSVAPSPISAATRDPISRASSPGTRAMWVVRATSTSTPRSMSSTDDLGVAEGPRHPRVELGDHQRAACAGRLDRGGQHVDLEPEGHLAVARGRGVHDDHVRARAGRGRAAAPSTGGTGRTTGAGAAGTPGPTKRRLRHDPVVQRQVGLGVEGVQARVGQLGEQGPEQGDRRGEVAARDHPRARRPSASQCSRTARTAWSSSTTRMAPQRDSSASKMRGPSGPRA